jgi:hypothetical protein
VGIGRRIGPRFLDRDGAASPKKEIFVVGSDLRAVKKASKMSLGMEDWVKKCQPIILVTCELAGS